MVPVAGDRQRIMATPELPALRQPRNVVVCMPRHTPCRGGRVPEPPITGTVGTQLAAGRGLCSPVAQAEPVLCETSLRGEFTGSSEQGLVG